ncbi:unnamed protein product [Arabis nemorensis]|uniref:Uncharacterized protein n=1 Tax=Arabis nemorensis TaxID=586526 RepID=A0A565BHE6_9BRAS|nr:unnamed protein product [Arabis nemorensis]
MEKLLSVFEGGKIATNNSLFLVKVYGLHHQLLRRSKDHWKNFSDALNDYQSSPIMDKYLLFVKYGSACTRVARETECLNNNRPFVLSSLPYLTFIGKGRELQQKAGANEDEDMQSRIRKYVERQKDHAVAENGAQLKMICDSLDLSSVVGFVIL